MSARVSLWAEFPGKGYVPVCAEHGDLKPEWTMPTLGACTAVVDEHNEAKHTTPQERAIREAYGLLERAGAYGKAAGHQRGDGRPSAVRGRRQPGRTRPVGGLPLGVLQEQGEGRLMDCCCGIGGHCAACHPKPTANPLLPAFRQRTVSEFAVGYLGGGA